MKRAALLALAALSALVFIPAHATDTVVATCGGDEFHRNVCEQWFELSGDSPHLAIFRLEPSGPVAVYGTDATLGFTGQIHIRVSVGPGAVRPCPDGPVGVCDVTIQFVNGQPMRMQKGTAQFVPYGSTDVPVEIENGAFPMAVYCSYPAQPLGDAPLPCDTWPGAPTFRGSIILAS